jgi:predicted transport protein
MNRDPQLMMDAVVSGLKDRTGHDLDEWLAMIEQAGLDRLDQNAVRRWLRIEHGVPQNSQWAIADAAARAAGWQRPSVDEYVAGQFEGDKAHLRPIYDRLAEAALALGPDVTIEGRATYVPFVRKRQFALVAASTKSRIDLGLRYRQAPASKRLVPAKSLGQVTHRVALSSPDEVDAEVLSLLRAAYDQN